MTNCFHFLMKIWMNMMNQFDKRFTQPLLQSFALAIFSPGQDFLREAEMAISRRELARNLGFRPFGDDLFACCAGLS